MDNMHGEIFLFSKMERLAARRNCRNGAPRLMNPALKVAGELGYASGKMLAKDSRRMSRSWQAGISAMVSAML